MHPTDAADMSELFVGSPLFSMEDADSCEMTREWIRRERAESAVRLSGVPRQIVEPAETGNWQFM